MPLKTILLTTLVILSCTLFLSCKQAIESKNTSTVSSSSFSDEKLSLGESVGTQAYLFGAALSTQIYFRNRMKKMVAISQKENSPIKMSESARDGLHFNEIVHTLNLANHHMKIAGSPNVDTRYSIIFFNLEQGPQILKVPPISDRYYSINITDAYLGNRPYICSRKGDTQGGQYIFTGPDWTEEIPSGLEEIKMPQNEFLVVIRIRVKDPNTDNPNVTEIQNQFDLRPFETNYANGNNPSLEVIKNVEVKSGIEYFEQLLDFMKKNPPEGEQSFIWNMFQQVGVTPAGDWDPDKVDSAILEGIEAGIKKGEQIIQWKARQRGDRTTTGWYYSLTMGVDHDDYLHRSEWAVQGLTVGSPIEAMFFNTFVDGDDEALDGSQEYTIHIPKDKMPPVNAFWSITSYGEDFNLVKNDELHYGVGIRNKNMKYNSDGSLTFKVQHEKPAEGIANWIPTPASGPFKLNFRFYNPKEVMFDKEKLNDYLPPVEKLTLKN